MKRRDIVKGLTLLPLAGAVVTNPMQSVFASAEAAEPNMLKTAAEGLSSAELKTGPQIFQSIGVETFVNCKGTNTIMGGSVTRPAVRAAMEAAAPYNVQMDELAFGVGQRLAEITGAEWGMVP